MLARSSFQMESPSEQDTPGEIRSGKHSFSSCPSRQGHCPRMSCSHPCLVPPLQKAPGMPEQPTTKSFSHSRGGLHETAPPCQLPRIWLTHRAAELVGSSWSHDPELEALGIHSTCKETEEQKREQILLELTRTASSGDSKWSLP